MNSFIHFSKDTRGSKTIELANLLGLRKLDTSAKHLGLPLISLKSKTQDLLNFLVDKVQAWVASWKLRILSRTSELTLIQSVGSNLEAYVASFILIPLAIYNKINNLFRKFCWASDQSKIKFIVFATTITFVLWKIEKV